MAMELCIDLAVGMTGESARAYVDSLWYRRPHSRSAESVSDVSDAEFELAVRDALPSLTTGEASALWLVDVCGASYAEAATSMHCTERTIERSVARARRRIRDAVLAG